MALLRLLLMAAVVFLITRWLRRALTPGASGRRPVSKKPWWDDKARQSDTRPKLQTLQFRRDPHEVLGLAKGASRASIDEAYERLIRENSPESVSTMGEEIQDFARRKTEEIQAAYAALTEEEN